MDKEPIDNTWYEQFPDLVEWVKEQKMSNPVAGWYVSSVAQWIPEYFTEKPMNYDGPFETWQKALEFLFKEISDDMDELNQETKLLKAFVNRLANMQDHGSNIRREAIKLLGEIASQNKDVR